MATRAVSDLLGPASTVANRRGELTPTQRGYVGVVTGVRGCGTVLLTTVGLPVFASFAVATLWLPAESGPSLWPLATAGVAAVGLAICVGSAKSLLRANLARWDLTEGRT